MFRFLFTAGLFLIVLSGRVEAQEATSGQTGESAAADYRSGLEQETFSLINQYRKNNKMTPFLWNDEIAKVARGHSADMATKKVDFGHEGFGKRVKVLSAQLVGLRGAGENVLETSDPNNVAQAAVQMWLHSPHHLANIRGDFNYSGMGVWVDDQGVIFFTQFFVKLVTPTPQAAQTPPPTVVNPFIYLADPKTR